MKKSKTIADVIRRATARELEKMATTAEGTLHDGWKGDALATWITPGIIRSVTLHLKQKKPARKKITAVK